MSFLLDTDICSYYLKNDPVVVGRVMMHFGGLKISHKGVVSGRSRIRSPTFAPS
jgi:hypothetical protein